MELLFWIFALTLLWCFAGYPLFMITRARYRPRSLRLSGREERVSVVLPVRNEAGRIGRRLKNLLALDYPRELIEIIVVCNGCTDGTDAVVEEIARFDPRVRLFISPAEHGKAGAVNAGVAEATADFVVFADARQRFQRDALRHLLAPFAEAGVGAVSGRLVIGESDDTAVSGFRSYWQLETALRSAEGRTGSMVGTTGAIYAIRRDRFETLPVNLILDDVYLPMRIAMKGKRVVMAQKAVAFDVPAGSMWEEYRRKRRTMVGNLQLIRILPAVLLPWKNPLWIRFTSHKLLRLATPLCFLGMVLTAALLPGILYTGVALAGLFIYGFGFAGLALPVSAFSIPAAFVLMHRAIASAFLRYGQDASVLWVEPEVAEAVVTEAAEPVTAGRM